MKSFIACVLLTVSFSAWAQDLKIVSYGPKSGPTTNLGMLISKNLSGEPDVVATGDCQEATRQFDKESRAIAVVGHASMVKGQVGGKKCTIPFDQQTVFMVDGHYDVCRRPNHKGKLTDPDAKISVPAVFPVKQFVDEFNRDNRASVKAIGVAGGGEAMASLLSGDVEYTILPRFNSVLQEQAGKVVCQSLRAGDLNWLGLEYKVRANQFYFMVFVMHKGLTAKEQRQLVDSFNDSKVRDWLKATAWHNPKVLPAKDDLRYAKDKIEEHRKLYQR